MAEDIEQKVRDLLRATDDESGWYSAVRELDSQEAVPVLLHILEDDQEGQASRRLAVMILGILGDNSSIPALVRTLHTSDRILRGRAAETLGQFRQLETNIIQQLIHGLQDEDYYFRECCANALGQLKLPEALPALTQMSVSDDLSSNREAAKRAIEAIQEVTQ